MGLGLPQKLVFQAIPTASLPTFFCASFFPFLPCPPHPGGRANWVPFVLLAFFPLFYSNFWPNLGSNPCSDASCGVVTFSLVLKAFQVVLGSGNPKSTICPFRARKWPFQAPKTLRFKGKMSNFQAKKYCKTGGKTPKGQMVPISRVYTPPFPRQCSSPKSPLSGTSDLLFLVEKM